MRHLTNGAVGLLRTSSTTGHVHIDLRAYEIHTSEARWIFKSIGILLAKAIIDNQILGVTFDPLLITILRGEKVIQSSFFCTEHNFDLPIN